MIEPGFYNMDCMEAMKQFPEKYFDLAVVDPPYGINVTGRHKAGKLVGGGIGRLAEQSITILGKSKKRVASLNPITPLTIRPRRTKGTLKS